MRLLDRLRKPEPPPEGAHGQRNIDGSYFSVWLCQEGHGNVAAPDTPPDRDCMQCSFDRFRMNTHREPAAPTEWRLATASEARGFIFDLEGFSMDSGIGFRMLV